MNLVILYPHYLFSGDKISFSTGEARHPSSNIVTGSRSTFFRSDANYDNASFIIDTNTLTEAEQTPDYIYIAGLNLSIASGGLVNVKLQGDDDSSFSSAVTACSQNDIALTDLVGRKSEDFILEVDNPAAKRYWKARVENGTGTSDFKYCLRKIYCGQWFYFGTEPDPPANQKLEPGNSRRNGRSFSLTWSGVSNATLKTFLNKIYHHRRYNPVVLYARSWDGILNGETVIHAQILSYNLTRTMHDKNTVNVNFMELI